MRGHDLTSCIYLLYILQHVQGLVGHFGIPFLLMVRHLVFLFGFCPVIGCYICLCWRMRLYKQSYNSIITRNYIHTKLWHYKSTNCNRFWGNWQVYNHLLTTVLHITLAPWNVNFQEKWPPCFHLGIIEEVDDSGEDDIIDDQMTVGGPDGSNFDQASAKDDAVGCFKHHTGLLNVTHIFKITRYLYHANIKSNTISSEIHKFHLHTSNDCHPV